MKRWFIKVFDSGYVNKNQLHRDVKKHVREEFDNKLTSDIHRAEEMLSQMVDHLNKKHSRCRPVRVDSLFGIDFNLCRLSGINGFMIRFIFVRGELGGES